MDAQVADYANMLRRSKIALFDSSVFRYQYQKYPEAALAGTLIIADLPAQDEELWKRIVVPVSMHDSDNVLIETVKWWIEHDEERKARALAGQRAVAAKYTYDHAVDVLLQSYHRYKSGLYGFWFPYSFSLGCSAINHDGGRNEYCTLGQL